MDMQTIQAQGRQRRPGEWGLGREMEPQAETSPPSLPLCGCVDLFMNFQALVPTWEESG